MYKLFFELLQVALDKRKELSKTPTALEWEELYHISNQQTLTAILYAGIERLPKEQQPDLSLAWTWNQDTQKIEVQNQQQLKRCGQLQRRLYEAGFQSMILKGQSLRPYYPEHLRNRRTPGDIDVWAFPINATSHPVRDVIEYSTKLLPGHHLCYLHYDFPVFSDIPVEIHFRPSFLCQPHYNRRLQELFLEIAAEERQAAKRDTEPQNHTWFFILLHIYKHLFEEGIGLRQLLDYYLIYQAEEKEFCTGERQRQLATFGLTRFHEDLLDVLRSIVEPEAPTLVQTPPRATFLLNEILTGGNFGQYDPRIHHEGGAIRHAWEKLKHNLRLLRYYPSEVLWEPLFRLYHWLWRILRLWRKE